MSDAPKEIWVDDEREIGGSVHVWNDGAHLDPKYVTKYIREDVALTMVAAERESPPFLFDRYQRGQLMAEGIGISKASTLEQATAIAVKLAYPGDVLVCRPRTPDDAEAALDALLKAEREKALREALSKMQLAADVETAMGNIITAATFDTAKAFILALIEQENGEA